MQALQRQRPIVCMEGNIGSGKTTAMSFFDQTTFQVLCEPVTLWKNIGGCNLLEHFYKEPSKFSFPMQLTALATGLGHLRVGGQKPAILGGMTMILVSVVWTVRMMLIRIA